MSDQLEVGDEIHFRDNPSMTGTVVERLTDRSQTPAAHMYLIAWETELYKPEELTKAEDD